jgi:diaminohydroxyphosphoribosylaminopyrimidine deaminase / 5-amino-6-(5-phosphoribosylamino)uracil reductase
VSSSCHAGVGTAPRQTDPSCTTTIPAGRLNAVGGLGYVCVMAALSDPALLSAHQAAMRAAIADAERARGRTGDNPWVGCAIVAASGELLATGHTQGPGEDHAEIVAMQRVRELGVPLSEVTLYSTLEPCSFHGRTPACSRAIIAAGVRRIVIGIRDPNPRVDGLSVSTLREAGLELLEGVCEHEISVQLAPWIFRYHPHEPLRRASALMLAPNASREATIRALCEHYGLETSLVEPVVAQVGQR